jgi:HD-GYP domain-containing protein (c-di-GMP phosphodiesterase class II)
MPPDRNMEDLGRSNGITLLEALGDQLARAAIESEDHRKRVTAFTIALARAMGLKGEEILILARGAFLHDLGKISIPAAILQKPAALTPEETEILRTHCWHGYRLLKGIPFLSDAAEMVYAHHENYDGTGYPRGLRGTEIPMGARILAVADALEDMTCDSPGRSAMSVGQAVQEIARQSGKQFDPNVVSIAVAIPVTLWTDLRAEIDKDP